MKENKKQGWLWDKDNQELVLFFEVEGLGEDEFGNPCEAGAAIKLGGIDQPSPEKCEEMIRKIEADGLLVTDVPQKATSISFEEWVEKGYFE